MIVYVLKLQQGKYYVGMTNKSVQERFEEHVRGNGSAWTRKYPPLSIESSVATTNRRQENNETLNYMERYGIENVRGGIYSKVSLTTDDMNSIQKNIRHDSNKCIRCGRAGHYQTRCYLSTHADGSVIDDESDEEEEKKKEEDDDDDEDGGNNRSEHQIRRNNNQPHNRNNCNRCGRTGHHQTQCYASTHADGSVIVDEEDDDDDGNHHSEHQIRTSHGTRDCYASIHADRSTIVDANYYRRKNTHEVGGSRKNADEHGGNSRTEQPTRHNNGLCGNSRTEQPTRHNNGLCQRCGRTGHYQTQCYASTHADGSVMADESDEEDDDDDEDGGNHRSENQIRRNNNQCYHCGHTSHSTRDCYASVHADGSRIVEVTYSGRKNADEDGGNHRSQHQIRRNSNQCDRCGRTSHCSRDCYASVHADGSRIVDLSCSGRKKR